MEGRSLCSVGIPQSDYNVNRNIVGSLPSWARRSRPFDCFRFVTAASHRALGRTPHPVAFRFSEPYLPRVDLLHFFNSLAFTQTPWISTFEHCLPRWERADESMSDAVARAGADLILGKSCRRLLAISDASLNIARRDWERRFGTAEASRLAEKVEVLLPPQSVILEPGSKVANPRPLLAFLGGDFYRKGGLQTLEALHLLEQRGVRDWDAVVVGRLDSFGDYASATDVASRQRARELLGLLGDRVSHHERLPPADALDLLQRADFYVFPTLADTFGYSALEAVACGCVVITTNVRAMAEVFDDATGLLIRLPLDENREVHRRADFSAIKDSLVGLLEQALCRALGMPRAERLCMAERATARLRARHSPAFHARSIESVYREALGIS